MRKTTIRNRSNEKRGERAGRRGREIEGVCDTSISSGSAGRSSTSCDPSSSQRLSTAQRRAGTAYYWNEIRQGGVLAFLPLIPQQQRRDGWAVGPVVMKRDGVEDCWLRGGGAGGGLRYG